MSTLARPTPTNIAAILESDIDQQRTDDLQSNKFSQDLIIGMPLMIATKDDPPYVIRGQKGVLLQTKGIQYEIVTYNGRINAIWSTKYVWEKHGKLLNHRQLIDPDPIKPQDQPEQDSIAVVVGDGINGNEEDHIAIYQGPAGILIYAAIKTDIHTQISVPNDLTPDDFPTTKLSTQITPQEAQAIINANNIRFNIIDWFRKAKYNQL